MNNHIYMKWIKQTVNVPENVLGFEETKDYNTPTHGFTIEPDGHETFWTSNHRDLHYITAPVLVRRPNGNGTYKYAIDIRRKFDSYKTWIWCKFEGAEDCDDLEWMPILDAKVNDEI